MVHRRTCFRLQRYNFLIEKRRLKIEKEKRMKKKDGNERKIKNT